MRIKSYKKFVLESIHPKEATNSISAILTLCDGRRTLGYFVSLDLNNSEFSSMFTHLLSNGFQYLSIKGESDPFILYKPERYKDAIELKNIAEKYNGYLSTNATEQETRRIGQILEYDSNEIENFIKRIYKIS